MAATVAIIPARGGSKGIPRKNLADLCGKPLVAWSILHARGSPAIDSVWVTSDSEEILEAAQRYGAQPIRRPADLAGDSASSESAWLHALDTIEARGVAVDRVVGLQATSPIRESDDITRALAQFERDRLDSLFTCCEVRDFFTWTRGADGAPVAVNYDYRNRRRRQELEKRYLENGSFYVFRATLLRATNNRLGGQIGMYVMETHKMFQVDEPADLALCEAILRGYGLDRT